MFTAALCSSCPQLLAAFRFLCLQLGYAAFRLRHWWVVAVSRLRSNTRDSAVNQPSLLPTPQVTTLVTTVFLVVKVILSNVSDLHLTSTPPHSASRFCWTLGPLGSACCFLGCFNAVASFSVSWFGSWLVIFPIFCSFRTTRPPALGISCPRMHLATCCPSPRSWWPGWRPGSWTSRCWRRKLTTSEVRAPLPVGLGVGNETVLERSPPHLQPTWRRWTRPASEPPWSTPALFQTDSSTPPPSPSQVTFQLHVCVCEDVGASDWGASSLWTFVCRLRGGPGRGGPQTQSCHSSGCRGLRGG